ncbi:MAG TPA: hypothetical protein VGK88_09380 [bacterium]
MTSPRWLTWHALVGIGLVLVMLLPAWSVPPSAAAVSAGGRAAAFSGTLPGRLVTARVSSTPPAPTPEQMRVAEELMAKANRSPQVAGPLAEVAPQDLGPAVPSPAGTGSKVPGTYTRFRVTALPVGGIVGGSSYSSFVNEPSTAVNGKFVFQTGNWYAGYSVDNGATWSYLNPFTLFGTGFCCDQVVVYDPSRDRVFWLLQFGDHLAVANAAGTNLTAWCYYNFYPATIGQLSNTALDYNEMAVGRDNLYFTTNIFPAAGGYGAEIVRLPLDGMAACGSIGFNYYAQTSNLAWVPVIGANQGRMYWGTNWTEMTKGSTFRVFWWDENSGTLYWYSYNINAFAFMTRNSGQNCASQDGVVKNWCQFSDSRTHGGALTRGTQVRPPATAGGLVQFTFDVKQGGFAPFPWSRRVYFRESDLAYLGDANLYGSWGAIQFLDIAPNARGDIGYVFAWGGGTGTTHYFPGTAVGIDDQYSPSQPWTNDFVLPGVKNPCTYGGLYRWGDYLTARPLDPAADVWVATGYTIRNVNCPNSGWFAQPYNVVFGRERDTNSYNRWKAH